MSEINQIKKKRFDKILKHVAFYLSKKRKKQTLIFCLSILSSLVELFRCNSGAIYSFFRVW